MYCIIKFYEYFLLSENIFSEKKRSKHDHEYEYDESFFNMHPYRYVILSLDKNIT